VYVVGLFNNILCYVGAATSNNFSQKLAAIMPNKNIINKDTSNCAWNWNKLTMKPSNCYMMCMEKIAET